MNIELIYGDIGGTKTILQIAQVSGGEIQEQAAYRYDSQAFASFSDVLRNFLNRISLEKTACFPDAACFAVAGPVDSQHTKLTNLPWIMDAASIQSEFAIPKVKLINDFKAAALAVEILPASDLVTLQSGKAHARQMRVVLGAGTGMGVAWLTWQNDRYVPLSTEAGHMDFAPTTKLQNKLLESLQNKFGHVSIERLLSGSGLTNIFNFLQTHSNLVEFSGLTRTDLDEDSGSTITNLAYKDKHPIAIKALEMFAEIYGAFAGNLALAGLCRNGVYIAGGIAPKIVHTLAAGGFIQEFRNKGRFSAILNEIPVYVITNPRICLLGAQREAHFLVDSIK